MKRIIEVMPDYSSSGLWLMYTEEELKDPQKWGRHIMIYPQIAGVSEPLQIALKYWHEVWEFEIAGGADPDFKPKVSQKYMDRWGRDGKKLAALMSAENDKYEFIYVE